MSLDITADMVESVRDIALRAGEAILAVYDTDFDVEKKHDASPVTEADRRAEALILEALRREITDAYPIIAEEEVAAGRIPEIDGGPFWLVDPLDGTKEFVKRQGEFTVNIALIEDGRPCLGVVHAPAKNATYWGSPQRRLRPNRRERDEPRHRLPADAGKGPDRRRQQVAP